MNCGRPDIDIDNFRLTNWIDKIKKLCKPDRVWWCNGSEDEYKYFCDLMVKNKTFFPLDPVKRPGCYLVRTDLNDTGYPNSAVSICCESKENAGPNNNWVHPTEMTERLEKLFSGCMVGRTMYVVPFSMGPVKSKISLYGVEVTDSLYTVISMYIITRIGTNILRTLENNHYFIPCIHSVGMPIQSGVEDIPWPCNLKDATIAYFTDDPAAWSFGSGFGGNVIFSKHSVPLRLATSFSAKNRKFLVINCGIIGLTSPNGAKYYVACGGSNNTGKRTLLLSVSTLPGWTQTCFSSEISWMNVGKDGRLWAINPERGFFGMTSKVGERGILSMMDAIHSNTIFTNVALTPEGDVWWEGMTKDPPPKLIDWTGQEWTPGCGRLAAHPNSRYTTPAVQCPVIDPEWENPNGVPICAIVFANRRSSVIPLVTEAFSWQYGVLMSSIISTEENNHPSSNSNEISRDAFSMTQFCSRKFVDYVSQWLYYRQYLGYSCPKIFSVNWFIKKQNFSGSGSEYVWPGFSENSRVLKWICERCDGTADAARTAVGYMPHHRSLDTNGLDIGQDALNQILCPKNDLWINELDSIRNYLKSLGPSIPDELKIQTEQLNSRLHIDEDEPPTHNRKLLSWVDQIRNLCKPDSIHWCSGLTSEYDFLCGELVRSGTLIRLNPKIRPNCYLARSDPRDVARVESKTFICCNEERDAGPTNNWCAPDAMKKRLNNLFDGCMRGRTMYIVPFCMGPLGSPHSKYGVEITDSAYVVINMHIMVRVGNKVLYALGDSDFLPCLHSVGIPLSPGQKDVPWPCDPENTTIAHFPDDPSVMSYGSGYGGNALLGKKCYALRIASVLARREGWLAEHMLILGITSPENKRYYITAAFPSACGKTNLAMLVPTLPGWTVRCVGDDIAWLHTGENGRLFAINPESGFFGVAPGTNAQSNISAMMTIQENTIFTNVALTPEGDVWWEGMTKDPPPKLIDWTGQEWTPGCGRLAAHPNSRYTTPAVQCPVIDPEWENPNGVPICAIVFGGRRQKLVPLVTEAFTWQHGVFMGSIISSEQTAAAEGSVGIVRRDPFAMIPFCGYNMGDYFSHWIEFRNFLGYNCPKIFYVNWFRKENGKFLWPGFGENSRVLKWICQRIGRNPTAQSIRTPIGHVPSLYSLDVDGLDLDNATLKELLKVDSAEWMQEIKLIREFYAKFGSSISPIIIQELNDLEKRLNSTGTAALTNNRKLLDWVNQIRNLCKPDSIYWCTGSEQEFQMLASDLVDSGAMVCLNPKIRPNCYLARSDPRDVARVESKTFICCNEERDAGPTNNWCAPDAMKKRLNNLFDGCMRGRTMYIVPFCMGPLGSPHSKYGVEITDSAYVVINMHIMVRVGNKVLYALGDSDFLPCLHSVGIPLSPGQKDVPWPCDPENTTIAHFPDDPSVMSYGSGYGGNALLGKKCYALRIASVLARREGWLAEHMLILGITSPENKRYYITAAFPSACGKTNLAMLVPTLPGWTVRCVGDDIAWLHTGENGRLFAINPESGFFGVAPGTNAQSNISAMMTIQENTIFTNVALTPEGDVWWEGMTKDPPPKLIDWTGQEWTPGCGRLAAHPNSRYTTPAVQCPVIDPEWENPNGVPICAIVFGGRRQKLVPLVTEAFIWEQGVFMASIISSEQTAAAEGSVGVVRRDPFAMIPFCGYNMGDYFSHWIDFRKKLGFLSPKIFYVNWFRKENGKFLWPGFGENSRVLKWICERVDGVGKARATPIGYIPTNDALDIDGLDISRDCIHKLTHFDSDGWLSEITDIRKFYDIFGDALPKKLLNVLNDIESHLKIAHFAPTNNKRLLNFIKDIEAITKPDNVVYYSGSQEDYDELCDLLVERGTFIPLNEKIRPNSFLARTDSLDCRKEVSNNFVCSSTSEEAGLGNNWADSADMLNRLHALFDGCMRGRTMYVIPFCLGPLGSPYSKYGVEITDSPYVVVNVHILTRAGLHVLSSMGTCDFWSVIHSVGYPLVNDSGEKLHDIPWPCCPEKRLIAHFPQEKRVWSYGSNYGSNCLPLRIPLGLRIATYAGYQENWLAERMAIISITSPNKVKHYIAIAAPEGCGKSNLVMSVSVLPGWTVRCVSDDISWIHIGEDNKLWAINPEAGLFDVAVTSGAHTTKSALATLKSRSIFVNTALTYDSDVWWEGMDSTVPQNLIDWEGKPWSPQSNRPAAHPNARYSAPMSQCPVKDPQWDNIYGVPISAIIFANRRSSVLPWIFEAPTWERGILYGATLSVDKGTATLLSSKGPNYGNNKFVSRHPFGIYPLCGYNIGKYLERWLLLRKDLGYDIPKIFAVNWFREDPVTKAVSWPGYDQNMRMLKWIFNRINNSVQATKTPLGLVPMANDLDLRMLDISQRVVDQGLSVNPDELISEVSDIKSYFDKFDGSIPQGLYNELDILKNDISEALEH